VQQAMITTLGYSAKLVIEECCNCHIAFAVPRDFYDQCVNAGPAKTFYCPLGHAQHYVKSEVQRLRDELERTQRQKSWAETNARMYKDQLGASERSKAAIKGQLTKTKKRVANGVCPFCTRHFVNVERHMKGQHSEYAAMQT
jgi:hypothetical protein